MAMKNYIGLASNESEFFKSGENTYFTSSQTNVLRFVLRSKANDCQV